jgi:hypothetical protein
MSMMQEQPRRLLHIAGSISLIVLIAVSSFALLSKANGSVKAASSFGTRCGIHFCLNGKAYYYAGANSYDIFTFGDGSSNSTQDDIENKYMDKAAIDAYFANAQSDQIKVIRTWMFDHETWHGFEPSKGVYNEAEFDEFDYIIQSAKAHGIMLIAPFENYWEAYGGIDTRLQWEGLGTGQSNRWKFFNQQQCPGCFTQYKNYVSYVLNRVNHYSGVAYKDDPTIFAWELMNEPRYENATPDESTTGITLRAWVDTMGAYVKSIDANHMLSAGLEGQQTSYGYGGNSGNPFVYINQSPYIDFTTAHPYPTASWANLTMDQTKTLIKTWISDSHNTVGKPFVMEEYNSDAAAAASRSAWWGNAFFPAIEQNDGDGDNFWMYEARNTDSVNGVAHGASELTVFQQHSQYMQQKSGGVSPSPTPTTGVTPTPSPTPTTGVTPTPTPSAGACKVSYSTNTWPGGFTANITITNTGSAAINGWTLRFTFPGTQQVMQGWNGVFSQSGANVTITNASYNGSLSPSGSAWPGFTGSWSGSNPNPTAFTLNGSMCSVQ